MLDLSYLIFAAVSIFFPVNFVVTTCALRRKQAGGPWPNTNLAVARRCDRCPLVPLRRKQQRSVQLRWRRL